MKKFLKWLFRVFVSCVLAFLIVTIVMSSIRNQSPLVEWQSWGEFFRNLTKAGAQIVALK